MVLMYCFLLLTFVSKVFVYRLLAGQTPKSGFETISFLLGFFVRLHLRLVLTDEGTVNDDNEKKHG